MNLLVSFLAVLLLVGYAVYSVARRKRVYSSPSGIKRLLKPADASLIDLLHRRAIPNQRLVHAFGITNTFVSGDAKVHRDFLNKAKFTISGLSTKGEGWRMLGQTVDDAIARLFPADEIPYATLIQCLTLRIFLVALFKADPESLHAKDLRFVTDMINRRWAYSKNTDRTALNQDNSLSEANACLDRWVRDRDGYPNPLDLIIPAYETMWRVVAVTVAHVCCHDGDNLLDIVLRFADQPTEEQFQLFREESMEPSMKMIIMETLRLHPPTKRISRAGATVGWKRFFMPTLEVADIQAVHQSSQYGHNPAKFDPMRFHPSRGLEQPELFPFGYGRLSCPAALWAPIGAALIVAKVAQQLKVGTYGLIAGPRIGDRGGWDGWKVINSSCHATEAAI
ncbi:cytochrome P450 [Pisolithus albus]|nr:cytochrome P450 [Pisolithus albus]